MRWEVRHMADTYDVERIVAKRLRAFAAQLADMLQAEHDRIMRDVAKASTPQVAEAVYASAGALAVVIDALRKAKS